MFAHSVLKTTTLSPKNYYAAGVGRLKVRNTRFGACSDPAQSTSAAAAAVCGCGGLSSILETCYSYLRPCMQPNI